MSWSGTMTCTVTNQTGGTITNLSILHQWEGFADAPNPNPTASLAEGASISFTINVGSGGSDEWSLRFIDATGACWYRDQKQCDVEDEDLESGQPVLVNLLNGNQGFSIEMPESSSCTDNYYDSCS
ncbi:MAG TPA: hypothetical protein VE685_11690 [Thermoanaerobaculia bacterium]|nr:hypothetical protein [Thermoanaerobaculia bacterium]